MGGVSAPVVICPHTLLEVPGHYQVSPWLLKRWSGGVALQVLQCLEMVGFGPSGCSASVSFVDVSLIPCCSEPRWSEVVTEGHRLPGGRGWLLPTASLTPLSLCAHWFFGLLAFSICWRIQDTAHQTIWEVTVECSIPQKIKKRTRA